MIFFFGPAVYIWYIFWNEKENAWNKEADFCFRLWSWSGCKIDLAVLYNTAQTFFLSTEIFTWFLSVLKKLFAQIFAQKYWQMFILNIQSLKVTLLPSFLKYATINSSQKKKDQLLSFNRKRPYLSGSLSLRTSCTLKNNNTTNCSFFPKLFSTLDAFITYSRTPGKNRKKY